MLRTARRPSELARRLSRRGSSRRAAASPHGRGAQIWRATHEAARAERAHEPLGSALTGSCRGCWRGRLRPFWAAAEKRAARLPSLCLTVRGKGKGAHDLKHFLGVAVFYGRPHIQMPFIFAQEAACGALFCGVFLVLEERKGTMPAERVMTISPISRGFLPSELDPSIVWGREGYQN